VIGLFANAEEDTLNSIATNSEIRLADALIARVRSSLAADRVRWKDYENSLMASLREQCELEQPSDPPPQPKPKPSRALALWRTEIRRGTRSFLTPFDALRSAACCEQAGLEALHEGLPTIAVGWFRQADRIIEEDDVRRRSDRGPTTDGGSARTR